MSWRRIALAAVFVVVVTAAVGAYAFTQPKRYEATARVVVQPIPPASTTFTGVDVLRASGDTARDLGTAAGFFETPDVVSATATRLSSSPSELRRSLVVRPLAGSNVLLVTGKSSSPQEAAQIANGIVQEGISQRTARVQAQISAILDKLSTSSSTEARRRAIDLLALQNRPDPTLETLSAATAPTSAAWPKPVRAITVAGLSALGLAVLVLLGLWVIGAVRKRAAARPRDPGMDDREVALERRAGAIDQRERELQQVVRDAQKATDATNRDTARIEARVAAVTMRERALATQAAQLAQRERELADQQAALEDLVAQSHKVPEPEAVSVRETVSEPEPEPDPMPEPEPEPEPEPVPEPEAVPEPASAPARDDFVALSHKVPEPEAAPVPESVSEPEPEPEPEPEAGPEPESEPVPEPAPVPVPVPEGEPVPASAPLPEDLVAQSHKVATLAPLVVPRAGGWTIDVLERLVAERGDSFPDKVEEWRYYVVFLGEHAGPDGSLPASFDFLIEETFAELL